MQSFYSYDPSDGIQRDIPLKQPESSGTRRYVVALRLSGLVFSAALAAG